MSKNKLTNSDIKPVIPFNLVSPFAPTGDQLNAIAELTKSVLANEQEQVLLGTTG